MHTSAFFAGEFFLLILFSIVLPTDMYLYMTRRRTISRKTLLLCGSMLVVKSAITLVLLQRLAGVAINSPSALDDRIFASPFSVVLYCVPVLLAGIGVNMLSHILIRHLADAERRFLLDPNK